MAKAKAKTLKVNVIMGRDECEIRSDAAGDGNYGAKRGKRTHTGIDLVCIAGETVISPVTGKVTKIGYPYASGKGGVNGTGQPYRYVQVTRDLGEGKIEHHRIFYIEPLVKVGDNVKIGRQLGTTMDVSERYDTDDKPETMYDESVESVMTPHIHYEIMLKGREFLDPAKYSFPEKPVHPAVAKARSRSEA